ncbi:MAG: Mu-like prophage major head subunit gpT family protein [Cypionkella sp.]|uniref:Mu-like prophage major head subunit gpT family protein n=1 Tax=Cypionkella sp. TaxID=2811411 RepID=UPI002ABC4C2C|nr:Mu-like prophage major head subunit gpT family protein [Cypionkella sp.]MDZ4309964.1 Mu-like prophage major head subunit gpT family protein [Cypionkella sp.]
MIIDEQSLELSYKGFQTVFNEAREGTPSYFEKVAMTVSSGASDETYGWIANIPGMREWIGQRQIKNLTASKYTIANKLFESTVSVKRTSMEDDRLGVYKPAFAELGSMSQRHPDTMIFSLMKSGFAANCYDGQFFFDTDHPMIDENGDTLVVANTDGGAGAPWFLLDTSRAVRPMIWQERLPYEFQQLTKTTDPHVFMLDEYIYGVRARVNAGFGLWQLAWGSKQALNPANYAAARAAMQNMKGDGGRILGVMPNVLVVPPSLETDARTLLKAATSASGASNPWFDSADLIITPYLA